MIRFHTGTKVLGAMEVDLEDVEGEITDRTETTITVSTDADLPYDYDTLIFDDDTARDHGFEDAEEMVRSWSDEIDNS